MSPVPAPAREQRQALVDLYDDADADEWDVHLDRMVAHRTIEQLGAHHRSALTLRHLDGLPVRQVAECLGRSEGATEVLLVRARKAFRHHYEQEEGR